MHTTGNKHLQNIKLHMQDCTLCPRNCHVNRANGQVGYCGQTGEITAARAALHFWEEPCISGTDGSGTVFFSGCNLRCVFCQNHDIALGQKGKTVSLSQLVQTFLKLQELGAHNINLVTPSHFIPQICYALEKAKTMGLHLPIVYNTGSYEEASSLRMLEGLIDIYLPDLKYFSPDLSLRYSRAQDYFEKAASAINEMYRQVGSPQFDPGTGLMTRGMIVRHLLLPGQAKDSKKILRYLHETYKNDIYVSIMNQYTPLPPVHAIPELNRKVTDAEYTRIVNFANTIGITSGFIQEGDAADESFIPPFDFEGLL